MSKLKPCPMCINGTYCLVTGDPCSILQKSLCNAFKKAYELGLCAQPANEPLCAENENFIQSKFGYCFYSLGSQPFIYNLYVHPQYRRCGHSRMLLKLVISQIRKGGCGGEICIQAEPRENSIGLVDLTRYYKNLGLTVCRPPERSE